MFDSSVDINKRIERRNRGSSTKSRLHESRSTGTGSARSARGTSRSGSGSARPKTPDATSGCSLHDARIHTAEEAASPRSKNVGVCNRQIVAGNRQIQVVLQSK